MQDAKRDAQMQALEKGSLPANMFEMDVVKDAMQRRIDAGDITPSDIDVLRKSYTWVSACTTVGMLTGIPVYIVMSRRPGPRLSIPFKLFASTGMSMVGTFLGFTVGGAAASWEVHRRMPDTRRKLQVFEEIALDARRAIAEHRAGIPDGTVISHTSGVPAHDRFSGPDGKVQPSPWGDAVEDRFGNAPVSDEVRGAANAEMARRAAPAPGELPSPRASRAAAGAEKEDELARKKREFEEMLERERRGGGEDKKW